VSDDARIQELEERLAEFSAALGRERAERERAARERDEYKKLYELVMLELERVKRHLRAQNRSEKVDAAQVQLAFAEVAKLVVPPELAQSIADQENEVASRPRAEETKSRAPHGRNPLPEHLPFERTELHPTEEERRCACCGKSKVKIGEETSHRLDHRPASLIVLQTARIKYAPDCSCESGGIVIPSPPGDVPVDKGLAGPGLLAHVIVSKYADHLPLHRLEERFDREGVHIARSTMCDWVEQVADLLRPIAGAMAKASLSAHRIHTDDTGIPILAPGSTHKGHVWVYVADDDYVTFRYTARRKSDGPREFLKGYSGYIQADAANLYDRLFDDDAEGAAAKEVGCWAHARRRFFDAQITDRERALVGLGFIKKLYEADRVAMKLPPSRRTGERRRLCTPLLDAFKVWLDAEALVVLPKAPIADAIGYVRNQWDALIRFVEDARLKLDNNAAERQLRRVAVGRKNWLFAGSEDGAERACVLYSLLATCKLHGVNPFDYLRDVLLRVASHPASDVLALNPKAWKQKLQHLDAARNAPSTAS
jgi:transposase